MPIDQATLAQRLRDARNNCGLTQEDVASTLALPRTAIAKIEGGNRSVSTRELAVLADLYHRPVMDFFNESTSEEPNILVALHRIAPDFQSNRKVDEEVTRHVKVCQTGVELRTLLGLPQATVPPEYDLGPVRTPGEAVKQGNYVAREERRRLGLGDSPIPDMADLITAEGIWATGADLPDEMSGVFLRHSSLGMVILVNFEHPRARKRFSYAHEYAHALLDRNLSVTISRTDNRKDLAEVRANAFAAAFLMPEGGVAAFLAQRNKGLGSRETVQVYDGATDEHGLEVEAFSRALPGSQCIPYQLVARLAHYFGVSYQAAVYRLKALARVNDAESKRLLALEQLGLRFLEVLKMKDDLVGIDTKASRKADRELIGEVLDLAVEAYIREEISRGRLVEIAALLKIPRDAVLELAEA